MSAPPPPAAQPVPPTRALADPGPSGLISIPELRFDEPTSPEAPGTSVVDSPLVRARVPGQGRSWKKLLVVGLGLVVLAGLVGGVFFLRDRFLPADNGSQPEDHDIFTGEIRNLRKADEKIFRLVMPQGTWQLENNLRSSLKATVALQRTEPDVWLAVAAQDFGLRQPRHAEVLKEALDRLKTHFGETLELAEKSAYLELAGQRAQGLEFKGKDKQGVWRGACLTFAHQGIGYALFIAAPTLEEAQNELSEVQKDNRGFMLLDSRSDWQPKSSPADTFAGKKFPISLQAPEGVWEKFPAEEQDERADLFLFGRYLQKKDNRKNASVLVAVLDKKEGVKETLQAARAYFAQKLKEEDKDYQVAPLADKGDELGVRSQIGDRPGRVLELGVHRKGQPSHYILLAVVHSRDQAFAFRCQSAWENRHIWKQDFLDLLGTFQVLKKK